MILQPSIYNCPVDVGDVIYTIDNDEASDNIYITNHTVISVRYFNKDYKISYSNILKDGIKETLLSKKDYNIKWFSDRELVEEKYKKYRANIIKETK